MERGENGKGCRRRGGGTRESWRGEEVMRVGRGWVER